MIIGDRFLETQCWGPAPDTAPAIVLLHEGLGCVALWRRMNVGGLMRPRVIFWITSSGRPLKSRFPTVIS